METKRRVKRPEINLFEKKKKKNSKYLSVF